MTKNILLGPVATDIARQILGADAFRQGGGWGKLEGRDVYLCMGALAVARYLADGAPWIADFAANWIAIAPADQP